MTPFHEMKVRRHWPKGHSPHLGGGMTIGQESNDIKGLRAIIIYENCRQCPACPDQSRRAGGNLAKSARLRASGTWLTEAVVRSGFSLMRMYKGNAKQAWAPFSR